MGNTLPALGILTEVAALLTPDSPTPEALSEAAAILRRTESYEQTRQLVQQAIRERYRPSPTPAEWYGPYIRDFYGDKAIFEWEGKTWSIAYTVERGEKGSTVTLGEVAEVEIAYVPVGSVTQDTTEAEVTVDTDFVPLVEAAVRRDGTVPLKLIQPGWGSSGYYSAAMLERDGPKLFKSGTKMYWDHPTVTEAAERPERSLRDLAAELVTDARWDAKGSKGPGLYADAKVFGAFRESVNELAPHIGPSIRALGTGKNGTAEGRTGRIIESIAKVQSVDFVTAPGAGGEILQLFEAARGRSTSPNPTTKETKSMDELQEARRQLEETQRQVEEQRTELARLREASILRDARDFAASRLASASLPDVTKTRLAESLSANPPAKDGALDREAFATRVEEAVKSEAEYLAAVGGVGRVHGMGGGSAPETLKVEEAEQRLGEAFGRLGLSESAIKHAVAGR